LPHNELAVFITRAASPGRRNGGADAHDRVTPASGATVGPV